MIDRRANYAIAPVKERVRIRPAKGGRARGTCAPELRPSNDAN